MQASKGGTQPAVLPGYGACEPRQQPPWYSNLNGTTVAHIPWW